MAAKQTPVLGYLMGWNEVALYPTALDHYNADPDNPSPMYAEQFGPTRTSRALAIAHLAIFEAVNTISGKYPSYKDLRSMIVKNVGAPADKIKAANKNRALAEACYRTLVRLYPNKKALFDNTLSLQLAQLGDPSDPAIVLGAAIGVEAAAAVLGLRYDDKTNPDKMTAIDYAELPDLSSGDFASYNPRSWHQDPISKLGPALGGNWPRVTPFVLSSGDAFRKVLRDPRGLDPDPARNIPGTNSSRRTRRSSGWAATRTRSPALTAGRRLRNAPAPPTPTTRPSRTTRTRRSSGSSGATTARPCCAPRRGSTT
jgi:hypothetical protein